MGAREDMEEYLKIRKQVSGKELSDFLGISRQAVNKHLKMLTKKGKIRKQGTTKGAVYRVCDASDTVTSSSMFKKRYLLHGAEEHSVFKEVELNVALKRQVARNVFNIVQYAFTEMMNNAIEHSRSKFCDVEFFIDNYNCNFTIRDFGIGIFHSIFKKFGLTDESAAVGELIKGKTTTMRERHTGERVFFTSKSADLISFQSHKTKLVFNNKATDVFIAARRFLKGTEVTFTISRNAKRRLEKIFNIYAPEEFEHRFEKTRVFLKLFSKEFISRSEAKRMLSGLHKFKEIIIDFQGVQSVGQGFADEIFRIFKREHPQITIKTENLDQTLKPIIDHVVDNNNLQQVDN